MMTMSGPRASGGRRNGNAMRQPLVLLLAGSAALAAVTACTEEPSLYLSGPPGAAATQHLSNSSLVLIVGDSVALGARVEDEVGNTLSTAPSVSSCDNAVVMVGGATGDAVYTTDVWLHAAGLGVSCVVASSAGFADTVRVTTGPAAVKIFGPNLLATTDTVLSGAQVPFTIVAVDRSGATLSGTTAYDWTSSAVANLAMHRLTGQASGKSPGLLSVRLRAPGGAMDSKAARVIAGVFGGTLSAPNAAPGQLITVNRASDGPFFDADAAVSVGGVAAWVDSRSASTMTFAVPATGVTTAGVLSLTNLGPGQVAQNGTFTSDLAFSDVYVPASTASGTAPSYTASKSAAGWVYFTHSGYGTGALSRGVQNGGIEADHYFTVTAGPSGATLTEIRLEWTNGVTGADFDLIICTLAETNCSFGFSGDVAREVVTNKALLANTTYYIAASAWTSANNIHNFRLRVQGSGFN